MQPDTDTLTSIRKRINDAVKDTYWFNIPNIEWLPTAVDFVFENLKKPQSTDVVGVDWGKPGNDNTPPEKPIKFTKTLREYSLQISRVRSATGGPEDIDHQIRSVSDSIKWVFERRMEDEFLRLVKLPAPDMCAHLDARLTSTYERLKITTHPDDRLGGSRENPLFSLHIGSDALRNIGSKSTEGFVVSVNPSPARYEDVDNNLVRVEPLLDDGSYNHRYHQAPYETAYATNRSVFEIQVPKPEGEDLDPKDHLVDVAWVPDGENRRFLLATLTMAVKPKYTDKAFTILFRRSV